ncbi:hypothetical protein HMPREF9446_00963 [Bacteroides fluxus YIT 12057]|uniref:Uncharacterized protein n=1 Tax=Bacteroides fluxus YIT 12057 TaxID=763034 RepID=F3PQH0_9BACE|nr:hypothetical protein HMPREF9446_00963 [Bacteroides fluxus YIT 12057]
MDIFFLFAIFLFTNINKGTQKEQIFHHNIKHISTQWKRFLLLQFSTNSYKPMIKKS